MECDLERKKEGGPEWRDPEGARENKKKKSACQGKEKVFKKYEGKKRKEGELETHSVPLLGEGKS